MKKSGFSFLFGLLVGGGLCLAFSFSKQDIDSFPTPFSIHNRQVYRVAHDTRFKIPFWTKQRLTSKSLEKSIDRSQSSTPINPRRL